MGKINTALGAISADEMGTTLIHEHLICGLPGWECDGLAVPYDRKVLAKTCAEALQEAKSLGLNTMVDATPIDLARDAELARMVSEKAGVNIVLCTGLYNEHSGGNSYFKARIPMFNVADEIYETFMKEITQGIGNTGIKAGAIKVATGTVNITKFEGVVLQAAAKAQRETGVPIITHTDASALALEQATALISEGADPKRMVIGHMCGSANLQYQVSVLQKGVYIAFDRFGLEVYMSDALKQAAIIGLLKLGYDNHILLSHDHFSAMLGRPWQWPPAMKGHSLCWDKSHIFKRIIPSLREAGIGNAQINNLMVNNPRRLFTGE